MYFVIFSHLVLLSETNPVPKYFYTTPSGHRAYVQFKRWSILIQIIHTLLVLFILNYRALIILSYAQTAKLQTLLTATSNGKIKQRLPHCNYSILSNFISVDVTENGIADRCYSTLPSQIHDHNLQRKLSKNVRNLVEAQNVHNAITYMYKYVSGMEQNAITIL